MGLVACGAAFKAHRCVLKGEWTALVSMTLEATGLVGGETPGHRAPRASVRVMAIDARHRPFRQPVAERLLKLRHYIGVAGGALPVDGSGLARYQPERTARVNFMTRRAGHLILGMAALQTASVRWLAKVASQTHSVRRGGSQLSGIANIRGGERFGMFLSRTVAGFASLSLPASLAIRLHGVMRIPAERIRDILVTSSARFGTGIRRRRGRGGGLARGIRH